MTIDLTGIDTKAAFHMLMKRELGFPDWYGVNWDAFSNRPNPTPPGTFAAARAYLPILKPLPAMHLRTRIIDDVNSIADLQLLHQLFDSFFRIVLVYIIRFS